MNKFGWLTIFVIACIFATSSSHGVAILNTSDKCADILLLFARGSSSNLGSEYLESPFREDTFGQKEEVPGAFFRWMEKRITTDYQHIDYKAVSIHYSGKGYSQNGYPAVGIFNPDTIGNALQAKFSWWKAGEYTDSVSSGAQELAGYVRDSSINCPNQRIVVGGYSQGAHVVHEALKIIPENERSLIDNAVLFGDPKFLSADYDSLNILDKPRSYPWHRGTASLREKGLAGAEDPYVPSDMWYKTISWCHEDDFVCTGFSGLSWAITNHEMPGNDHSIWNGPMGALGDGHTRYPVYGIPEATGEVMENLRSQLSSLEKTRGGIDPKVNSYQKVYDTSVINSRPVDMMLALDYTAGNEDSQAQYFLKLKDIIKQYKKNFIQLNTGGLVYTDFDGNAFQPNKSYIAGYARQANQLSSVADDAFKGNVFFGGGLGGGGDYPENHGMIIERGGMFANWRPEATKHFVIFSERPSLESYSYNMCSASNIASMPHSGETPCAGGAVFSTRDRPEWCESSLVVITKSECPFNSGPVSTKIISRSLQDAVTLARAKGFVVDIVQPHTARNTQPAPYTPSYVENQLKTIAESTGGLYLKYELFDEPAMRDAVWQILNHRPNLLNVSTYSPGSLLNFDEQKILPELQPAVLKTEVNKIQYINTSPVSGARSYGWDFDNNGQDDEISYGPSVAHIFTEVSPLISVRAYSSQIGQGLLATKTIPTEVVVSQAPSYTVNNIDMLTGTSATRMEGEGTVSIHWDIPIDAGQYGLVLVKDKNSGVLLQSVPVGQAGTGIESFATEFVLQYIDRGAEADEQVVTVLVETPTIPPDLVTDPESSQNPDDEQTPVSEPMDNGNTEVVVEFPYPPTSPAQDPVEPATPEEQNNESHDNNEPQITLPEEEPIIESETPINGSNEQSPPTSSTGSSSTPAGPKVENKLVSAIADTLGSFASTNNQIAYDPSESEIERSERILAVAGSADVKTNPQSEVGGIDEVNQLFDGEDIGRSAPQKDKNQRWWIYIVAGALVVSSILLIVIMLKKRDEDE